MAVEYSRDDAARTVRITGIEPLGLDEVLETVDRTVAEHVWHYAVLVDLRRGALGAADAAAVLRHIVQLIQQHGPHGPVAIVARQAPAVAGSQIYAFRGVEVGLTVDVFWDIETAVAWIGRHTRLIEPEGGATG